MITILLNDYIKWWIKLQINFSSPYYNYKIKFCYINNFVTTSYKIIIKYFFYLKIIFLFKNYLFIKSIYIFLLDVHLIIMNYYNELNFVIHAIIRNYKIIIKLLNCCKFDTILLCLDD